MWTKMVNKFVPAWQIVRVKARSIKDPGAKLSYVVGWLMKNPSQQNYERVCNWIRMTPLTYSSAIKEKWQAKGKELAIKNWKFDPDEDTNLDNYPKADLMMVLKDLKGRKYGFQFNKTPASHTAFVKKLEAYLGNSN